MSRNRRYLLKQLGLVTASLITRPAYARHAMPMGGQVADEMLDTEALAKFVDPLPIPQRKKPSGFSPNPDDASMKIPRYRVAMKPFEAKMHRDMPPTTLWGYDAACPGPVFEVQSGQPVLVEWANELPKQHLFPVDHTLHGAEAGLPDVRTVVHLHGARTGPESDGYPEDWFVPGEAAICHYPNRQEATCLFYHDHAMGITRINALAGLVGTYIIRDAVEASLNLPSGPYEVPLVLFDRSFCPDGKIHYPVSGNPDAPWISEYYGSAILVNGKIFPYLDVEPRKYRFRILNGSNGSFYGLSIVIAREKDPEKISFSLIGSDQGFLDAPQRMDALVLGPAERGDIIVDFEATAEQNLLLMADGIVVMQFRVDSKRPAVDTSSIPKFIRPIPRTSGADATVVRLLTLNDGQDRLGRSHGMLLNNMHWDMPVTETTKLGSTEIWSFVNLTDDTHPIHLHLVRFQVLDRRPFDLTTYLLTQRIVFTGPPVELDKNESGWKDTVRVPPATVTRIIVKFEEFAGRYVWHCHVLEHEDNEMMRPYIVLPA